MEAPDEMSDVPETPVDGVAEAAQGAVDTQADTTASDRPVMPDGWTGEFDPHRAKATIDRLREYERQVKNLTSDPDLAASFVAEHHGWQLTDDDEPDHFEVPEPDAEDNPLAREVQELKAWRDEQQIERTTREINEHINDLAEKAGVELTPQDQQYIFGRAVAGGNINPQETEKAFKAHTDWLRERQDAWQKQYLESKKAPAPPPSGTAGTEAPDPWDREARIARIAARMTAEES